MPATSRRFGLADALVLIAATAVGLAAVGTGKSGLLAVVREKLAIQHYPDHIMGGPEEGTVADIGGRFLAPWSVALVWLRLRRPRPEGQCLPDQPGFAAMATATAFMGFRLAGYLLDNEAHAWRSAFGNRTFPHTGYWILGTVVSPPAVACTVMAAWVLMANCGRWRPEPSWIDRVGRLVGIGWIMMALSDWLGWPVR